MSTIDTTTTVPSFDNITCAGCGLPAALSTKMGVPVKCPCGVSHAAVGVVVKSQGECSSPKWHEERQAEERAAREAERVKGAKPAHVTP